MTDGLLTMALSIAGLLAGIVAVRVLLGPPGGLGIGLFTPYRGDPWPHGVQEDDDAHFVWTRRRRTVVWQGTTVVVPLPISEATMSADESGDGVVPVQPVDGIEVRHPH
jgi:hypothetical protein